MKQYIDKSAVVAEINRVLNSYDPNEITSGRYALVNLRDFLDTLEVSENPDEQMIVKYLYEKKGYPIDLNGHLPSFEETMKDVEKYNKYKENKFIEKACVNLKKLMYDNLMFQGRLHREEVIDNFVETFKNYMKRE